jgi:transcriptional regulator with XRE-family HTH domain
MANEYSFLSRLLNVIQEKNISYVELERLSGVPKSAIQRYATGETKKIPTDRLFRIADALGVTPYDLMDFDTVVDGKYIAPAWEAWKKQKPQTDDDNLWTLREELRRDPGRRVLFDLAKNGSAQDIRQAVALIDALKATNPDYYDGDDPA